MDPRYLVVGIICAPVVDSMDVQLLFGFRELIYTEILLGTYKKNSLKKIYESMHGKYGNFDILETDLSLQNCTKSWKT